MASLYEQIPDALPGSAVATVRERLLRHPLLGDSQLIGMFEGSRGFGIAFRQDARPRVEERFGPLSPFLRLLDEHPPSFVRARWPRRRPTINAFYLNVLVVDDGRGVGEHVDGTLQEPAGAPGATPEAVTVLYLSVPRRQGGGQLQLLPPGRPAILLEPAEGTLLHFRGDLNHSILPLEGADGPRVSLICEQYSFAPEQLSRLAPLTVQSRAPDPVFAQPTSRPFARVLATKRAASNLEPGDTT